MIFKEGPVQEEEGKEGGEGTRKKSSKKTQETSITARLFMATTEQANDAIELISAARVRGHTLKPKLLADQSKRARLIVRNLPFILEESELKRAFSVYGPIIEVNIPRKPEGGIKGFAFVQFEHFNDAKKVLSSLDIFSRSL